MNQHGAHPNALSAMLNHLKNRMHAWSTTKFGDLSRQIKDARTTLNRLIPGHSADEEFKKLRMLFKNYWGWKMNI